MYFRVIVSCGHMGNKRDVEITRYFQADNALDAWESAMVMPRAKKQQRSRCVRKVEKISTLQYLKGKLEELQNPYLQERRAKDHLSLRKKAMVI